jgi:hypothetical protein
MNLKIPVVRAVYVCMNHVHFMCRVKAIFETFNSVCVCVCVCEREREREGIE